MDKSNYLKLVIAAFILIIGSTACMEISDDVKSSADYTNNGQTSMSTATSKTENSNDTTSRNNSTSSNQTSETFSSYDRQIVEAIYGKDYALSEGDYVIINEGIDFAGRMITKFLGNITSEEDAKEKAVIAWIALSVEVFKDNTDTITGKHQPYVATFYEEYDVWYVTGSLPPSGTDASGRPYDVIGTVPEIIMRESDGQILAIW